MESNNPNLINNQLSKEIDDLFALHDNMYQNLIGKKSDLQNSTLVEIESSFNAPFFNSLDRLGHYYHNMSESSKVELEQTTRNHPLYSKLQEAPYLWQTIKKPYGYAGDFKTMEIIYDNAFEGSTIFGKIYNKVTTSCKSCEGVRHRRSFLKKFILESSNGSCLAVAAGPGREITDSFSEGFQGSITAIDADMDALRHFKSKNNQLQNVNYEIVNVFGLLKNNFKTLKPKKFYLNKANPKKDTKGLRKFLLPIFYQIGNLKNKKFDLIYSAGLFDYIKTFPANKTKGTIGLTKILFDLLNPGGKLVIGIMSTNMPKGELFYMEVFCDWKIIFRSKAELMEFAKSINKEDTQSIEIQEGYEGIQAYLVIQKK